jgi:hypothetical protein
VNEVYLAQKPTHEMLEGELSNATLGFRRLGEPRLSLLELVMAQDDGAPTSDDAPLLRHADLRTVGKIAGPKKAKLEQRLEKELEESYRSHVSQDMDNETANDIEDLFADSSSNNINNNNSGLRAEFTGQHTVSATALLDSPSVLISIAEKTAQEARRQAQAQAREAHRQAQAQNGGTP